MKHSCSYLSKEMAARSRQGGLRPTADWGAWPGNLRRGEACFVSRAGLARPHCRALFGGDGLLVGGRIGEGRQGFVGLGFFLKRRVEQLGGVGHPEHFGPALEGAVAGDLVVLDRLGGRDQTGVERRRALVLGRGFPRPPR